MFIFGVFVSHNKKFGTRHFSSLKILNHLVHDLKIIGKSSNFHDPEHSIVFFETWWHHHRIPNQGNMFSRKFLKQILQKCFLSICSGALRIIDRMDNVNNMKIFSTIYSRSSSKSKRNVLSWY